MTGFKFIWIFYVLSLSLTLKFSTETTESVNDINDLEDVTMVYGFMETLNTLVESMNLLEMKISILENNIAVREEKEKNPAIEFDVLEVKCPNNRLPNSCVEVNECKSDVYTIMIPSYSNHSLTVSCDLKTDNGGWTVIQRRLDGSIDFYRNWTEYVEGFGDLNKEFYIGLEKLHILTTEQSQELYIILEDYEGEKRYAKYELFEIGSQNTDYKLTVGNYSGNAGDSLEYHNGEKFSTWDRDNDSSASHCAKKSKGAWWYKSCCNSSLNGKYLMGKLPKSKKGQGILWNTFRNDEYSLKFVQMMIRPRED